ncbi:hypothetical protein [Tenacibaculum sp. 190524A02b]|uniref:hypothetical protein n=1 Tax=Tenacibaculum vairaonense TaxID=3137860 RepID=UPI0031FAFF12
MMIFLKLVKNSIILLLFFSITSCRSQGNYKLLDKELDYCIIERVKQEIKLNFVDKETFTLTDFSNRIEKLLIENKLLRDKSKESYKRLFLSLQGKTYNNDNYKLFTTKVKKDSDYDVLKNSISVHNTPFECNRFLIDKNGLSTNSELSEYYSLLTSYFENGTVSDDWELNQKILKSIPKNLFNNINYRLPIIVLIYDNIE